MATLLLFALVGVAWAQMKLAVEPTGSYTVQVNGKTWLNSGDTRIHTANGWLALSDGSLTVASSTQTTGNDAIGDYTCVTQVLKGADGTTMTTAFYQYNDGVNAAFQQTFPSGIPDASVNNSDAVISAFPSFTTRASSAVDLGSITWHGTFIDDSYRGPAIATWPSSDGLATGKSGGPPMALIDRNSSDVVVVSSMSNFMIASMSTDEHLDFGILGSVETIPKDYSIAFMLHFSDQGLNNGMQSWGTALRKYYGKTSEQRENDQTLQYLGYNTDHGAYYYYNPSIGGNYNATLVAVYKSAQALQIPYKYILLDSWWYYKGPHDGVLNWTAMPSIFPPGGNQGMEEFHAITQWPVIGHNRWWSAETTYSKENGGDYDFSEKGEAKMVVPLEQRFWDDLMSSSAQWGLKVYEQDWLYNEFEGVPLLTLNISMARTWLLQMGNAATKNNMTIQYCMPYPRHALQSVEIQAVTQIRASDDYVPGSTEGLGQWHLGSSSILAHALDLAPFKDNFWTTNNEGPHSSLPNKADPAVHREALVATLTAGPVTPGDGVEYQNKELIMRSCRNDGRLINPDRPAVNIDSFFHQQAFGSGGTQGHVWATYTTINANRYDHIFSTELLAPYQLGFNELTLDRTTGPSGPVLAYALADNINLTTTSLTVVPFDANTPLNLVKSPSLLTFELWHTSPLVNGVAVLGDLSKWIPTAATRIAQVSADNDVTVLGQADEVVTVYFARSADGKIETQPGSCTIAPGSDTCVVPSPF